MLVRRSEHCCAVYFRRLLSMAFPSLPACADENRQYPAVVQGAIFGIDEDLLTFSASKLYEEEAASSL